MQSFKKFLEKARVVGFQDLGDQSFKQKMGGNSSRSKGWNFPKGEYLFTHLKKWIIDTKHSTERAFDRLNLSTDDVKTIFKRMIEKHEKSKKPSGEYLYYSKQFRQGFVVDYRPDKRGKYPGNHFVIITVLPSGRSNPKPGTEKVMIEKHVDLNETDFSDDFVEYMNEIFKYNPDGLLESESDYSYNSKPIMINNFKLDLILCENKFWDIGNLEVVEID